MSALHSLQKLISTLTGNELELCENYLQAFDRRGEKHENKSLKLFRLLSTSSIYKEQELEYLIYGKRSIAAFSRLTLRLKEKVLQAVMLPVNSQRLKNVSECAEKLSEVRTRLLQTEFLLERNLHEIAEYRLLGICETAEKHEFFPELLQAMAYLARFTTKEQQRLSRQMQNTRNRWQYELTCQELQLLVPLEEPAQSEARLEELRRLEQGRGSARSAFLLLEIEAQIAQKSGNLERAVSCRLRQLRLTDKNKPLQDGEKKPLLHFELAGLYFRLLRFEKALAQTQLCLPLYATNPEKRRLLLETEAATHFMMNKPIPAAAAIGEALTLQPSSKTHYLHALVLFLQGKHPEALEVMEQVHWKTADREQFGTAARVFMKLLVIENEPKGATKQTLRKLVALDKQMPIAVHLDAREQLIVDMMQALITSGLDFKRVYREFQGHIGLLRVKDGVTAWDLDRGELVVFQEWFVAFHLNIKYKIN